METETIQNEKISSYEAEKGEVSKVVLLFSGGLDTSCMVKYIQDEYKAKVVTVTIDLGQPNCDLEYMKQKAYALGAEDAFVVDLKEEFANEYISKAIKANALYQDSYPLSTAIARYLQSKKAVEVADEVEADAIAHGCTGKGNDQVRFDSSIQSLSSDIKILAPVRECSMGRDMELKYAEKHGIPVEVSFEKPYSTDENIWGKSSECGILEDPSEEPPKDVFEFVTIPEEAPDDPEYIKIGFEDGTPISLNGTKMDLQDLVEELNYLGGKHGVGIIDITEDRVVGLKSREVYECPAAVILIGSHDDLQKYCSTKNENSFKEIVEQKWEDMVYSGLWFDPLMDHLNSFLNSINKGVTGSVDVKLYKGSYKVVGRSSPNALYSKELATYEEGEIFNQKASPGFIELWNLQTKLVNELDKKSSGECDDETMGN